MWGVNQYPFTTHQEIIMATSHEEPSPDAEEGNKDVRICMGCGGPRTTQIGAISFFTQAGICPACKVEAMNLLDIHVQEVTPERRLWELG